MELFQNFGKQISNLLWRRYPGADKVGQGQWELLILVLKL
jgi:hypothetical protein